MYCLNFIQVMFLKLKCLIVHLVSQNVLISQQIFLNNQFIGIDVLHRNGRRYYNFDTDGKDHGSNFDYNEELNQNDGPFRKQDGKPWNPPNNSTTSSTQTTPMIFVTIPTNPPSITTPNSLVSSTPINKTLTVSSQTHPGLNSKPISGGATFNVSIAESTLPIGISPTPSIETTSITSTSASAVSSTISVETIATLTSPTESLSTVNLNQTSSTVTIETQNTSNPITAIHNLIPSPAVSMGPLNEGTGQETQQSETTTSQYDMTFPYSDTTIVVPGNQTSKIIEQAINDMRTFEAGYFTIFLIETSRMFAAKKQVDAVRLLQALEIEVLALLSANKLSGFGKSTRAALVYLVRTLNNLTPEAVQYEASLGNYLLMNRRVTLGRDIVNLMDETDKVYTEEEGRRILHVLEDIDSYPGNKTAQQVVHEMFDAVMIAPFVRMYGTSMEATMVKQLEELVIVMVFSGHAIHRRRYSVVGTNTPQYTTFQRYTPSSQITKSKEYTNKRKESYFKKISSRYTATIKKLRKKEKRKYTISKNKIKHNRPKIPKGIVENLGKPKVHLKLADLERIKAKKPKTRLKTKAISVSSKYNHKTTIIGLEQTNNDKINKATLKRFNVIKRKNLKKDFKSRFTPSNVGEESSFTDEEEKLKANLDDAFFHGYDEPEFRNRDVRREFESKHNLESSYSNEEAILKSKIYKALGYENNFAEAIKRRQGYNI